MPDRRPSSLTRKDFSRALIDFIRGPSFRRHMRLSHSFELDQNTPLFETGIVDSLGIVELLAFVEESIGERIPLRRVDMRYFGSVERIVNTFAPGPGRDR
jgi:acyl carrier protein